MVTVNCAYTEQINPADATPKLTREQVWKGLQRKIRRAQDFVPIIHACDVLEEKDNEVAREAHFKERDGFPAHSVKEVCKSFYPTKVDFWQPSGALITNTISNGPSLEPEDINMTYTFEWRHEDVTEGSEQHQKLVKQHTEGAKMAVHSSIDAMRRMAKDGELD